jgi:hypothetical protein
MDLLTKFFKAFDNSFCVNFPLDDIRTHIIAPVEKP